MTLNQFTFTCPIFNVDTKFGHCEELRHRVYRGERPEVRKGCQACMSAGKCPVAREVNRSIYQRVSLVEPYHSEEVKNGKLRAEVLQEIRPVIIPDAVYERFNVSASERALMQSANERIDKQLGSAPSKDLKPYVDRTPRSVESRTTYKASPGRVAPPKPKAEPNRSNAAATGDMSAALNT